MSAPNDALLGELYALLRRVPVVPANVRALDGIREKLLLARSNRGHPLAPELLRECIEAARLLLVADELRATLDTVDAMKELARGLG